MNTQGKGKGKGKDKSKGKDKQKSQGGKTREIEILAFARDDLHQIMSDRNRWNELTPKVKRMMTRKRDSAMSALEPADGHDYHLWQFYMLAPTNMDDFDYNDKTLRFLDDMFTEEPRLEPFSVFDYHTGMQIGTKYKIGPDGDAGDVEVNALNVTPWFPFDYAAIKNRLPDLTVYDAEGNPTIYNLIHDMRAEGVVMVGQFSESRGPYHAQRRTMQVTTNAKLGSTAFGLDPWSIDYVDELRTIQRDAQWALSS